MATISNLRLLYGYMFTHPGKKLFLWEESLVNMQNGKIKEQLDWHLFDYPLHNHKCTIILKL